MVAQRYESGQPIKLLSSGSWPYKVPFRDVLNKPLVGATVKLFVYCGRLGGRSRILIRQTEVDEAGRFEIPSFSGNVNRPLLEVYHPDNYGAVRIDPVDLKLYSPTRERIPAVRVPWVPTEAPAYERSFCAAIVDDTNTPISGAFVSCTAVELPNGDTQRSLGQVVTDQDGRFTVYPIIYPGTLISAETKFKLRIDAPRELGLMPFIGTVAPEPNCSVVSMTEYGYFHTFVFEDANGPITATKRLKDISIEINCPNKPVVTYEYKDLKGGRFLPLGICKASAQWHLKRYEFELLRVTEDSAEELVFSLKKKLVYCGQVVDGVTGNPMSGAFILTPRSSFSGLTNSAAGITPSQWDQMRSVKGNISDYDERLEPLLRRYLFDEVMHTDTEGRFEVHSAAGHKIPKFMALEENYLEIRQSTKSLQPDKNGRIKLPVLPLFPAAKVTIRAIIEDDGQVFATWVVDTNNCPGWVGRAKDLRFYKLAYSPGHDADQGPYEVPINAFVDQKVEIADLAFDMSEPQQPAYNFFAVFLYVLYDFVIQEKVSFFGIPIVVGHDYDSAWSTEDLDKHLEGDVLEEQEALELVGDGVWPSDACSLEEEKSDPNRIRTLTELQLEGGHFTYPISLSKNVRETICVPAGANLSVELRAYPNLKGKWVNPTVAAQDIFLDQGETLELGQCRFDRTIAVFAKVVNSAGKPVADVPVGIWFTGLQFPCALRTPEDGRIKFIVPPHTKGKFYVPQYEYSLSSLLVKPFQLRGYEDDGTEFTLEVPDEILQWLEASPEELRSSL